MRLTFSITLTSVSPWAISARPFLDVLSVQGRHGACKCWCVFSSEGTRVRGSSRRARETGINGMHHADLALFRRLLQQARPYCVHVIAIFLLGLLATPLGLLTPLPLKIIVDNVIGTHPPPWFLSRTLPASATRSSTGVLTTAVVLLLGVAALENLFALANSFLRTWTAEKLLLDFRVRLFSHLQRLSLGYHDVKGTTDSVYRIDAVSHHRWARPVCHFGSHAAGYVLCDVSHRSAVGISCDGHFACPFHAFHGVPSAVSQAFERGEAARKQRDGSPAGGSLSRPRG